LLAVIGRQFQLERQLRGTGRANQERHIPAGL
jgi:hypothetical protein